MARRFVLKRSDAPVSPESSHLSVAQDRGFDFRADAWRSQQRIYLMFEFPESDTEAWIVGGVILLTILVSTVSFLFQTVVEYESWSGWATIEQVCTGIFILEYLFRLYACTAVRRASRLGFFFKPLHLIDLLAILPFFLSLFIDSHDIQALRVLRAIRLLRLLRLFKLAKYTEGMQVTALAFYKGLPAIFVLFFYLLIVLIIFGSIFYQVERENCPDSFSSASQFETYQTECKTTGNYYTRATQLRCCAYYCPGPHRDFLCLSPNEHERDTDSLVYPPTSDQVAYATRFESVVESSWLVLIGVLTIGLGDRVNTFWLSKLFGGISLVIALITIALPMAIMASKFKQVYADMHRQRAQWKTSRRSNQILQEGGGTLTGLIMAKSFPLEERLDGLKHFAHLNPRIVKTLAVFGEYLAVQAEIRRLLDTRIKALYTLAELELRRLEEKATSNCPC